MDAVKKLFGLMMLGMAIWMLSRIASFSIVIVSYSFLLFSLAWFFGLYLPRYIGQQVLNRGLGLVIATAGLMLLVGGMVQPALLTSWWQGSQSDAAEYFIVVHNVDDLTKQLSQAQAAHRPVILDFYADWCESCVVMDHKVFNSPDVKKVLNNYILLRADLSANSAADEALLKYFNVIAPPTVLFFDSQGHETNSHRIVGEVDASEFMDKLPSGIAKSCAENVKC